MGKTYTILLFLRMFSMHQKSRKGPYRPVLLLVPSSAVLHQWVTAIRQYFPKLKCEVIWGGKPKGTASQKAAWVSMKDSRKGRAGLDGWHDRFKFFFNRGDSAAAGGLVICTYNT